MDDETVYSNQVFSVARAKALPLLKKNNIYIRELAKNKKEKIIINEKVNVEPYSVILRGNGLCSIGAFSYSRSPLGYGMKVGRYCSIASGLKVMGSEHFINWISTSPVFYSPEYHGEEYHLDDLQRSKRCIKIGHDVWIGENVTLSREITIGNGAVIASGAIVTKSVPDFAVVGGVPAKIIKYRFENSIIELIKSLEWWKYNYSDFVGFRADCPKTFLEKLRVSIENHKISVYTPYALNQSDFISDREIN